MSHCWRKVATFITAPTIPVRHRLDGYLNSSGIRSSILAVATAITESAAP